MAYVARFLAGIAGLLLVAFMTVLLMVPEAVGQLVDALSGVPFVTRVIVVLIIYIGLLIVLYARVRKPKVVRTDSLIVRASGAETAVSVDSVRSLVLKTVRGIPDVSNVQADVQSLNGEADITLSVVTDNDAVNVPAKQKEITRALEQVINKQLGLRLAGRPKVNIQFGQIPEPVVSKPPVQVVPPPRQEVVIPAPEPVIPVIPTIPVEPEKTEKPITYEDISDFSPSDDDK